MTLSGGTHNIRKLYVREALNITGGSLVINYDNPKYANNHPLRDLKSTLISAQFSEAVSLSGSASLSVYRLQVDPTTTFTLNGGSLTFNQIDLMPHSSAPATLALGGNFNVLPLENATATIANGAGGGSSGLLDLGGDVADRSTLPMAAPASTWPSTFRSPTADSQKSAWAHWRWAA